MPLSRLETDLHIAGRLSAQSFSPPASSITSAAIATPSGTGIEASKLQHQHQHIETLVVHGATPAAIRKTIHVVVGATATLVQFQAGPITAISSGTVTIDLLKNGTTILSATISLTSVTGTAYAKVSPSGYTSTALVVDDVLEVNQTVSAPVGGGGLWCQLTIREDAD
jgi:hypothetical protein